MPESSAISATSWAEEHIGEIEASRAAYDCRATGAKLGGRPFNPELLLNRSEKVFTPNDFGTSQLVATPLVSHAAQGLMNP